MLRNCSQKKVGILYTSPIFSPTEPAVVKDSLKSSSMWLVRRPVQSNLHSLLSVGGQRFFFQTVTVTLFYVLLYT